MPSAPHVISTRVARSTARPAAVRRLFPLSLYPTKGLSYLAKAMRPARGSGPLGWQSSESRRIRSNMGGGGSFSQYLRALGVRELAPATAPFDPGVAPLVLESHLE